MMPLPETIAVKLSSDDAGAISITRVVTQQMGLQELFAAIVAVTGKDAVRIHRILHAGTLLDGGTRYRWGDLDPSAEEIHRQLSRFPDPDPGRQFVKQNAFAATLREPSGRSFPLSREAAAKRRFLRRRSFWDVLAHLAVTGDLRYVTYSYREQADVYRLQLSGSGLATIQDSAKLLQRSTAARQIERSVFSSLEFFVRR